MPTRRNSPGTTRFDDIEGISGNIDDLDIGSSPSLPKFAGFRPLVSNADKTVTVNPDGSADYSTIQDALDQIPIILRHQFRIELDDDTYNEDAFVHPTITGEPTAEDGTSEGGGAVTIVGNTTDSTLTSVSSVTSFSFRGSLNIAALDLIDVSPYDDESAAISLQDSATVNVNRCTFQDITASNGTGIAAKGGVVRVNGNDFGTNNVTNGIRVKGGAEMLHSDGFGAITGEAADTGLRVNDATARYKPGSWSLTGGTLDFDPITTGVIFTDDRSWSDVTSTRSLDTSYTNNTGVPVDVHVQLSVSADGTNVGANLNVDGVERDAIRQTLSTNDKITATATVPPNSTYEMATFLDTANFTLARWVERNAG